MPEESRAGRILREMADRCDLNDEEEFGGCLVIIPPPEADSADVENEIAILLIDPAQSQANFWSTVKGTSSNAADEWQARQQVPQMGRY